MCKEIFLCWYVKCIICLIYFHGNNCELWVNNWILFLDIKTEFSAKKLKDLKKEPQSKENIYLLIEWGKCKSNLKKEWQAIED